MAQVTQTVLVDDIDGGDAAETVRFSLDGSDYEIELNTENAAALRDALAPYVASARTPTRATTTRARSSASARPASSGPDASVVRAWATANGYEVAPRGRISSEVVAAYREATEGES